MFIAPQPGPRGFAQASPVGGYRPMRPAASQPILAPAAWSARPALQPLRPASQPQPLRPAGPAVAHWRPGQVYAPPVPFAAAKAAAPAHTRVVSSPTSSPKASRAQIDLISGLLKKDSGLKDQVLKCYSDANNGAPLTRPALTQAINLIAAQIKVPASAFGDVREDFIRFDFDGDGMIEDYEWHRLVRCRLRAYLKHVAPAMYEHDIPVESTESSGYRTVKLLGEGSFGVVTLVVDNEGNERCMKKIAKDKISADGLEELKFEYEAMHRLDDASPDSSWGLTRLNDTKSDFHMRIAKNYGLFQDAQFIYFVNEPYTGGDLIDVGKRAQANRAPIEESWFQLVSRQCMEGLVYMHENAMMHCDIKEQNIMLRTTDYEHPEVVLIDYGLAREFTSGSAKLSGTPGYIPPETWQTGLWYPRGDLFSLGVTMLQMMIGLIPVDGPLPIFAQGGAGLEQWAHFSATRQPPLHLLRSRFPGAVTLIANLLDKIRAQRPPAVRALTYPWLLGEQEAPMADQSMTMIQGAAGVTVNTSLSQGVSSISVTTKPANLKPPMVGLVR